MRIESVEISDEVLDKLFQKHGVAESEVYEVLWNDEDPALIVRSEKGQGAYLALGRTDGGRYLTVVFVVKPGPVARVLTARDMDSSERRRYRRHER